jgi:hypothetical protein
MADLLLIHLFPFYRPLYTHSGSRKIAARNCLLVR